jgi:hypothetical protein
MGNAICRLLLSPEVTSEQIEAFAVALRRDSRRLVTMHIRDLKGKHIRKDYLLAIANSDVRIIDFEPRLTFDEISVPVSKSLGPNKSLFRLADDEGLDVTLPSVDWLRDVYPTSDLTALLEPDQTPIPWNTESLYVCPGNPDDVEPHVPIALSLLFVATPGAKRDCPLCANSFVTVGERGQCNVCGFTSWPFKSRAEALQIAIVPLDAFGFGYCIRCRASRESTHLVEQCFRCGKLLRGDGTRHKLKLKDNAIDVANLIGRFK